MTEPKPERAPLDIAQSLSPAQAAALLRAVAGRPILDRKAAGNLMARRLVDHVRDDLYDPTDLGLRVCNHLGKPR